MTKPASLLTILSFCFVIANSQARWQADVQIQAMTITCNDPGRITTRVTVKNHNYDEAKNTMLLILLPVEVKTISVPKNCLVLNASLPTGIGWAGCLQCKLSNLGVNKETTVSITTTRSSYGNRIGVFAYSESPDPEPGNNYKEASAVCQ